MKRGKKRTRRTQPKESTPLRNRLASKAGLEEQLRDHNELRARLDTIKRFVSDVESSLDGWGADLDETKRTARAVSELEPEQLERLFWSSPQIAATVREMHLLVRACLDAWLFATIPPKTKTKGAKKRRVERLDFRLYPVYRFLLKLLEVERRDPKDRDRIPRQEILLNFERALTAVTLDQAAAVREFDATGWPSLPHAACKLIEEVLKANPNGAQRSADTLEKSFGWIAKADPKRWKRSSHRSGR